MMRQSFRRVALIQAVWLLSTLVVLLALGQFELEAYFVLVFVGLLGTLVLYAPTGDPPGWWRPLVVLSMLCFLAFGYVVYLRFAAIG